MPVHRPRACGGAVFAVRALESPCIVEPTAGPVRGRSAGRGARPGARARQPTQPGTLGGRPEFSLRGRGGGPGKCQKFVYQKQPKSRFPFVKFYVFPQ